MDLFTWADTRDAVTCGTCAHLGAAINTGLRYCGCLLVWRWATSPACPDIAPSKVHHHG